jgi:hypothetical protein
MPQPSSPHRVLNALVAVGEPNIRDLIRDLLIECAGSDFKVVVHTPRNNREATLRILANSVCFDVCFLLLNNIYYIESEPRNARLDSSITLVRDLARLYSKPVVAYYGWPEIDGDYPDRVLAAGAAAVSRVPITKHQFRQLVVDKLDLPLSN